MQRNKTLSYDEDDLYPSDEADFYDDHEEFTAEDKTNFAALTPVVRAEVEEAGLQASDREIEDALWEAWWDVGAAVAFLKGRKEKAGGGGKGPASKDGQGESKKEKVKAGSRFDEAASRSSVAAGELKDSFLLAFRRGKGNGGGGDSEHAEWIGEVTYERRGGSLRYFSRSLGTR